MVSRTYKNNLIIILDYIPANLYMCITCRVKHVCVVANKTKYSWLFKMCTLDKFKSSEYVNMSARIYKIYTMLTYKLFL